MFAFLCFLGDAARDVLSPRKGGGHHSRGGRQLGPPLRQVRLLGGPLQVPGRRDLRL